MSAERVPGLAGSGRDGPVPSRENSRWERARLGLLAAPAAGAGRRVRPWVLTGWALECFSGPARRWRGRRAAPCVRVSPARFPPPPPPPFVRRRVGRGSRPPPGASSCRLWGRSVVRIAGRPAAGLAGPNQVSLVAAQGLGGPRCPETAVEELASCSVGSS